MTQCAGSFTDVTTKGPAPAQPEGTAARAPDSGAKQLTLMTKKSHEVAQGESDQILVTINRDNFNDPVQISVEGLPAGVQLNETDLVIPKDQNTITLNVTAGADAQPGEHDIKLTAKAPGVPDNSQTVKLVVKAD